jgi:Amidase
MTTNRREFITARGTVAAASTTRHGLAAATAQERSRRATSVPADLCFTSARELCAMIRARKVTAREVMAAHLGQIGRVNPKLNAIVAKLPDERCLALADEADRRLAKGETVGPLHGLPWAFKDLEASIGFPFTSGSTINKDLMPSEDGVLVARLRSAGVIPIGKTNVPEFGMGSHTYNRVYGTTLNPYDLSKSAGGSSGGDGDAPSAGPSPPPRSRLVCCRSPMAAIWVDRFAIPETSTTSLAFDQLSASSLLRRHRCPSSASR